jgi:hypothetical protein
MNKLKKQKINHVLNYEHFLKNNSLKKKKLKLKNILFENPILYKNQDLNIIELNNYENIEIPITVLDFKNINTIEKTYNNQLLFNYSLNYNILYNFNKIIFNFIKQKNNNKIKGKVIHGNRKKTFISILGLIFRMRSVNLNYSINSIIYNNKRKHSFNKYKFIKQKKISNKLKNRKIKKIIRTYTLRYLNFKIVKIRKKNRLSRIAYLKEIVKYQKEKKFKKMMLLERKNKKKNKSLFSRKAYEKKYKKKQ